MKAAKDAKNQEKTTVVQLIGDMKQNVDELLREINCKCGVNNHLKTIFGIYCTKIEKLRAERDELRGKLEKFSHIQELLQI
jgi:uncharacterized coiled-coil DUF342 family protein